MDDASAIGMLGALAQDTRLRAYRRLVQAGPAGLPAGALAEALGVPATTLSFHLAQLDTASLVVSRREGRSIIYAADFARMTALVGFLTENCCGTGLAGFQARCEPQAMTRTTMTTPPAFNVLFLCTGNSARSILAEAALGRWGKGKFQAFSAGSRPKGQVHPLALQLLQSLHYKTDGFRSKSWEEFGLSDAPKLDFVFTVCDNAASEVCPIWPGQPMTAHWGVEDPAAFEGSEERALRLFRKIYFELESRIKIFTSLPLHKLDRLSLQTKLAEIGKTRAEAEHDAG